MSNHKCTKFFKNLYKNKMVEGDEEYGRKNKFTEIIALTLSILALIIFVGMQVIK